MRVDLYDLPNGKWQADSGVYHARGDTPVEAVERLFAYVKAADALNAKIATQSPEESPEVKAPEQPK